MRNAQDSGDTSKLEELVAELKCPSPPNLYRKALQEGMAGLDVSKLSETHRTFASAIFPLLLTEELTPLMESDSASGPVNPQAFRHRRMRESLAKLFPTVPSKATSGRTRKATEARIEVLRNSIATSANGIAKASVKQQFLSFSNIDTPHGEADAQWLAVVLSLLSYQAADAKLASQREEQAKELEDSLARAKHLNSLIAKLFPKPKLENVADLTLSSTTPRI